MTDPTRDVSAPIVTCPWGRGVLGVEKIEGGDYVLAVLVLCACRLKEAAHRDIDSASLACLPATEGEKHREEESGVLTGSILIIDADFVAGEGASRDAEAVFSNCGGRAGDAVPLDIVASEYCSYQQGHDDDPHKDRFYI